jgi:peptide/nickel transport system substrate-binding protein
MGQALKARVQDWKAIDDKTFVLTLDKPFPLMLEALARPISQAAFIMPERIALTDPMKQMSEVVGCGPYKFIPADFVSGASAAFERFEGYVPRSEAPSWLSGGKVAKMKRVEWRFMPDAATAAAALRTGEIDWWEQVQPDLVSSLKNANGVTIGKGDPMGYFGIIRFNHLQAPFNNPKLRAAVLRAVNQSDYMQTVTGGDPTAFQICHSMFPCGTAYGKPLANDPMAKPLSTDELKALVKASGYNGEKAVIINPSDFPTIAPFGEITAALLTSMGINVELASTDWGTVLQRRASRETPDKGGWSIFHTWWNGIAVTTPATSGFLRGQGAKGWFGWYDDPVIESLTTDWLAAPDAVAQAAIVTKIQEQAFANVPTVPLGQFNIRSAWRNSLQGMVEGPVPAPWGLYRA